MLENALGPLNKDFIAEHGGQFRSYKKERLIYSQGDAASEFFYILSGHVLVTVNSKEGKEALIAILGPDNFFGECCVAAHQRRNSTVETATDCEVAVFSTANVIRALGDSPMFAKRFAAFLMERNDQLKASLVDQMFLSSEKRLARLLLKLAQSGDKDVSLVGIPINQEKIARMVGTTRSRINGFMNKFRRLGYIEYNGELKVHNSLNSVLAD